jgi:hypothetical protein
MPAYRVHSTPLHHTLDRLDFRFGWQLGDS